MTGAIFRMSVAMPSSIVPLGTATPCSSMAAAMSALALFIRSICEGIPGIGFPSFA